MFLVTEPERAIFVFVFMSAEERAKKKQPSLSAYFVKSDAVALVPAVVLPALVRSPDLKNAVPAAVDFDNFLMLFIYISRHLLSRCCQLLKIRQSENLNLQSPQRLPSVVSCPLTSRFCAGDPSVEAQ